MHKERSYLRCVSRRIEQSCLARGGLVPTEERPSAAPATATNKFAACLGDKLCSIADQLGIESENERNCRFDLLAVVVVSAQAPRRRSNQRRDPPNL